MGCRQFSIGKCQLSIVNSGLALMVALCFCASLVPGADADIVVLDARATPQMTLRMETVSSLAGELFLLQTCGDDRSVAEVYVAGERQVTVTWNAGGKKAEIRYKPGTFKVELKKDGFTVFGRMRSLTFLS